MAYSKVLTLAKIIAAIYKGQGLYQDTNRSYDSEFNKGADEVRIPKFGKLKARGTGVPYGHADRLKVKDATSMISIPVEKSIVPLAEEVEAKFNSAGLLNGYIADAQRAFGEDFDFKLLTTLHDSANVRGFIGDTLAFGDLVGVKEFYDDLGIPGTPGLRSMAVDAKLQSQLWDIDIIQKAAAFNIENLKSGVFVDFLGFTIKVTGNSPKVDDKRMITSWYKPGVAFGVANFMDRGEAYVPEEGGRLVDLIAFYFRKLFDDDFSLSLKSNDE